MTATMMLLRSFENGLATGLGCTLSSGICVTIDPLRAFQVEQLMRRDGVRKSHEAQVFFKAAVSKPAHQRGLRGRCQSNQLDQRRSRATCI